MPETKVLCDHCKSVICREKQGEVIVRKVDVPQKLLAFCSEECHVLHYQKRQSDGSSDGSL